VGLTDAPKEMFGKLMSLPDELMTKYYLLVLGEEMDQSLHPMQAKKSLAAKCVSLYHNSMAAEECLADWDLRFSKRDLANADLEVIKIGERKDVLGVVQQAFEHFQVKMSSSDMRRLIQQGSVQLDGIKLEDPKAIVDWQSGCVLRLDKKRSLRLA
jgi:tyrosyl-tRNA synthetase